MMTFRTQEKYGVVTYSEEYDEEYQDERTIEFSIVYHKDVYRFMAEYFEIKQDKKQVVDLLDCLEADKEIEEFIKECDLEDKLYDWCKEHNVEVEEEYVL